MPARNVVLTGHFNPIPTKYTVEHYLEDDEGSYPTTTPYYTEFTADVYTNDNVSGVPHIYNTYTYDPVKSAAENAEMTTVDGVSVPSGTVTADGKLVLKLYYTRNAYDVTYSFENNPGNITVPTGHNDVKHGNVVDLENITAPVGYTFDGWYHGETFVGDSLTMPGEDVELVGRFTPNSNVSYAVKYYLQNTDGKGYTEDKSNSYTATGTTGEYVVADTKEYPGFSFDTTQGAWNGHIKGDGSLVLELYYNRNSYTVSYYYFGTPPTDITISMDGDELTLSAPDYLIHKETVLYGAPMTVKSVLTASDENYEFRGWYTSNLSGVAAGDELDAGTSYTMPSHNVEFRGALYNYTVYYNLDGGKLNGSETVDPKKVDWDDADLLPEGTPEKDGMVFAGWTYSDEQSYLTSFDKYSDLAGLPDVSFIVLDANYVNGYKVTYDWGKDNIPAGVTLPTNSTLYAEGDSYTVDTNYPANYTVETKDTLGNVTGVYTFSGWTDPNSGVMGNANVTISGSWTYTSVAVNTWKVEYTWTNAPDGDYAQTIPASVYNIVNGASHTVDTTYTSSTVVEEKDEYGNVIGKWTFSGWDKSGTLTVTSNVTISGSWTYTSVAVDTWKVEYTWTNAPDGDYAQTIPASVYNLVNGASHTVDTTYTSSTVVEEKDEYGNVIGKWTFSGWDKNGTLTVTSDITISGSWTYEEVDTPVIPPVTSVGTAKLIKVDAEDNSTVLSGVVFRLYRENGTYIGSYTTDKKGEIRVSDLDEGNYYWLETRSAEGYVLDDSKHAFTVSAGQTASVVIENSKSEVPTVFGDDHYAYIIGYDDGLVHPEWNITRAEVATIFFRLLSEETRNQYITRENSFSDVNKGDWYNTAVSTMAVMGIVTGRPGNVFDPNANITRAEFAAIAARFEEHGNTTDASFSDIYEHWAKKEINIAANNGWVLGYEDGTFKPDQYITRAEAMTMVNRVLQRIPESVNDLLSNMVIWPDNMDTKKWYYLMVQEATNSHYYGRKVNGYEYWTEIRKVPDWTVYER